MMFMGQSLTNYEKGIMARTVEARKKRFPNQTEIAAKIGVTRETYAKYENRGVIPSRYISAFCEAVGISERYLLTGEAADANLAPHTQTEPPLSTDEVEKLVYDSVVEAWLIADENEFEFVHTEFAKLVSSVAMTFLSIKQKNPDMDDQSVKAATHAAIDNVVRGVKFGG